MILVFVFLLCLHVIITKSAHIIGLVTRDGAVLSSTSGFQQNGVTIDDEYEWICKLKSNVIVGFDGDPSDIDIVKSAIERIDREHLLKFKVKISCRDMAYRCRQWIADSLRSGNPLKVDLILAGWDSLAETPMPRLYWLDRVGSIKSTNYCTHGRYSPFLLSSLDRHHRIRNFSEIPLDDGIEIAKECWNELLNRAIINVKKFNVLTVNCEGIC